VTFIFAQLHVRNRLQRQRLVALAGDPFKNLVNRQGGDDQFVHLLDGPGKKAGVRPFGEIFDPPG
jgi:hypothetical protein